MPHSLVVIGSLDQLRQTIDADYLLEFPDIIENQWHLAVIDENKKNKNEAEFKNFMNQWQRRMEESPEISAVIFASNISTIDEVLESLLGTREGFQWKKQQESLHHLLSERLTELNSLELILNQNIEKKKRTLVETRAKLFQMTQGLDLLKRCLLSLQEIESIDEIEHQLLKILAAPFELSWIKIAFFPEDEKFLSETKEKINTTQLQTPLFSKNEKIGSLIALKIAKIPFSKDQIQFFRQLGEATAIALERMKNLEQTVRLKHEWEATFHAIPDPLLLIGENFEILQMNQLDSISGSKKCFEFLFHRSEPCTDCKRGNKFVVEHQNKIFEVLSQKFQISDASENVYVNTYIDMTEKKRIQRKMIESAKIAELGLVGSSIAHEINNPLGGLLSYIQLIKMDLPKTSRYYVDLQEMEKATYRCVEIVQKLLEFSRK